MGAIRTVGLVALAGLAAEATYAIKRNLPSFDGGDASGVFGDPSLPKLTITVLGDSSCTGPGLDDIDDIWIRRIARRFSDRNHVELRSLAVGGSTVRDILRDQVPQVQPSDVAIVAVGGNDTMRIAPLFTFCSDLERIVAALTPRVRTVVLSGTGDVGSMPRLPFALSRIMTALSAYADHCHTTVAGRHANTVKIPNRDKTTEPFRTNPDLWAPDLMHASALGHRLWADISYPTIEAAVTA